MGRHHDEIERIAKNPRLTDDERRWQINARRASAAHEAVRRGGLPISFDLDAYEVHVGDVTVADNRVELHGVTARRDGEAVAVDPHIVLVNPPLLVPDPDGDVVRQRRRHPHDDEPVVDRYIEDPGAIVVAELLRLIVEADQ